MQTTVNTTDEILLLSHFLLKWPLLKLLGLRTATQVHNPKTCMVSTLQASLVILRLGLFASVLIIMDYLQLRQSQHD